MPSTNHENTDALQEETLRRKEQRDSHKAMFRAGGWGCFFIMIPLFGLFVGLFLPFVHNAREAARRMQCEGQSNCLRFALFNYHDEYGSFPPAYTVDENGKPLHSWRVLILPYLESRELYSQIRLNEPWDSEHNSQFHRPSEGEDFDLWNPHWYSCPSDPRRKENCHTNWVMVVGENTISNGPGGTTLNDITDDKATTILFIETTRSICWMAPEDLTFEDLDQGITQPYPKNPDAKASSYHSPGIRVRCLDGSPRTLPDSISPETLKAMATINGGEKIVLP